MDEAELLTELRLGLLLGAGPKRLVQRLAKSGRFEASQLMIGLLSSEHPEQIIEALIPAHEEYLQRQKCTLTLM